MLVKKYHSEIVSIINPIEGIYTLEFRSLNGNYKYYPGQFLHLSNDPEYDGTSQWPESRCFSMQSNPTESTIRITHSIKGRFTKLMEQQLRIGSLVWLKLPYGDLFSQPHNKTNTVFISGGTGITPFLSLFTHESFKEYTNPSIYLGFRSRQFNIYQSVLGEINRFSNGARIVVFYDEEHGILNIEKILDENGPASDYFISGPPTMIEEFRKGLLIKGVPVSKIKTDDWE
jgi:nitric oxide dioxygenase